MSKQLQFELHKRDKEINELKVLIDTLQTNLRSAVQLLDDKSKREITNTHSYKWSANWKPQQS